MCLSYALKTVSISQPSFQETGEFCPFYDHSFMWLSQKLRCNGYHACFVYTSYMVSRLVRMNSQLTEIFLSSDTGLDSTSSKLYIATTIRNLLVYVFYNNIAVFRTRIFTANIVVVKWTFFFPCTILTRIVMMLKDRMSCKDCEAEFSHP